MVEKSGWEGLIHVSGVIIEEQPDLKCDRCDLTARPFCVSIWI
jgi:hypothetical protein